jgi:hypothetical protein
LEVSPLFALDQETFVQRMAGGELKSISRETYFG